MLGKLFLLRFILNKKDIALYAILFLLMIVGSMLEVASVGIVPIFIATISSPNLLTENQIAAQIIQYLNINGNSELIWWGCLFLVVIILFKNLYMVLLNYAVIRLTEYHRLRMSTKMLKSYMYAPYEFITNKNTAELFRNINSEVMVIFSGVVNPALHVTLSFLLTIGVSVLLFITTPDVALLSIAIVGLGSGIFLKIAKSKLLAYGVAAKEERTVSIKAINQALSSFVDARLLKREEFFIAYYRRSYSKLTKYNRNREFINKTTTPFIETVAVLGMVAIVLVQIDSDSSSIIPVLALFAAAITRLRNSLTKVVTGLGQIQFSIAAIPNVVNDYRRLNKIDRREDSGLEYEKAEEFFKALSINGVTFSYTKQKTPVLNNISVEVESGESVAFIGSTGSGKTTLIKIILGLLVPQKGEILIDGINLQDRISWWRSKIGYVSQEIFLIDDTIRSNIAFGLSEKDICDEKIKQAIAIAQLQDFIKSLPDGVNTVVGERGTKISGGQRQRIGLARALYHNPSVLILDEATSALDNKTENLLMKSIESLRGSHTIIMIAHRLSTVKNCDKLIYLKEGTIYAKGTFDELKKVSEEFKEMAELDH